MCINKKNILLITLTRLVKISEQAYGQPRQLQVRGPRKKHRKVGCTCPLYTPLPLPWMCPRYQHVPCYSLQSLETQMICDVSFFSPYHVGLCANLIKHLQKKYFISVPPLTTQWMANGSCRWRSQNYIHYLSIPELLEELCDGYVAFQSYLKSYVMATWHSRATWRAMWWLRGIPELLEELCDGYVAFQSYVMAFQSYLKSYVMATWHSRAMWWHSRATWRAMWWLRGIPELCDGIPELHDKHSRATWRAMWWLRGIPELCDGIPELHDKHSRAMWRHSRAT